MDVIDQRPFVCSICQLSFDMEQVLKNHIFDMHVSRFKRKFSQGQLVKLINDGHDYKVMETCSNEFKYKLVRYIDGQPMITYANLENLDAMPEENQMIYYENGVRSFECEYIESLILGRILEIVYDTDVQSEMFVIEKLSTGDLDYVRPEALIVPNQQETEYYWRILSTAEFLVETIAGVLSEYVWSEV